MSFRRVGLHGSELREAPTLETARLRLRAFRADDLDRYAELWRDPEMMRHILGRPSTDDESWFRLLRAAGAWSLLGYGPWAVEEKATGRFVGDLGFGNHRRALDPPLTHPIEAGWLITPACQRQGYAREGMEAILAWMDARQPEGFTLTALIATANEPSRRLAARLGFVERREMSIRDVPTLVLERVRPSV
jgi:RimJ/RimL family protein N-acetyltransferase